MFENIAAIDVGTSSIKVVMVRTGLKDFHVMSFIYEDIDNSIENRDKAIRDTLSNLIKENNLDGYKIITNLPMEKAIIRNITFPFNDIEKIADAIPYEAEENVPFKLEDLVMDFQPLKSRNPEEGRVLLAATNRDTIHDYLGLLNDFDIHPIKMGLEPNALFECYKYFNRIEDEAIIQLDIGNNKTVINIIKDKSLLYTRSISIGVNIIYNAISETTNRSYNESIKLFEDLNLDLTSFENNIQRDYYKTLNLNRTKLKKIYEKTYEVIEGLIEQILLTTKAFITDYGSVDFSRILISGGGSNIGGVGTLISGELDLPVVSLPFLEDYDESKIQTQFPTAFGTILYYLNRKSPSINFLRGDFLPDIVSTSRKIYYLPGAFAALSLFVLIIYIFTSSLLKSNMNKKYDKILNDRYRRYFHSRVVSGDPVRDAMKMLAKEKKEFENLDEVIHSKEKLLDIMKNVIMFFPKDESFELNNMVLNERIIRIDGIIGSSKNIDDYKNKLIKSKKFDSVSINTNITKRNQIRFSMTIKLKVPGKTKRAY